VQEIAPDLTDDQVREVLRRAKHYHDATIGISWDVLAFHADDVREEAAKRASKELKIGNNNTGGLCQE
jgi:hypothetical protein